jgi:hypothetical protein
MRPLLVALFVLAMAILSASVALAQGVISSVSG